MTTQGELDRWRNRGVQSQYVMVAGAGPGGRLSTGAQNPPPHCLSPGRRRLSGPGPPGLQATSSGTSDTSLSCTRVTLRVHTGASRGQVSQEPPTTAGGALLTTYDAGPDPGTTSPVLLALSRPPSATRLSGRCPLQMAAITSLS